jgi:hypothetical protein
MSKSLKDVEKAIYELYLNSTGDERYMLYKEGEVIRRILQLEDKLDKLKGEYEGFKDKY